MWRIKIQLLVLILASALLASCASSPRPHKLAGRSKKARSLCHEASKTADSSFSDYRFVVFDAAMDQIYCETVTGDLPADRPIPVLSASKWVSAATILAVVDAKKIPLNANIASILGESLSETAQGKIELTDLLRMQSGLPPEAPCFNDPGTTLQKCATKFLRQAKTVSDPGQRFEYGASHWLVAGAMAEMATHMSWNELYRRYLREPLELSPTSLYYTKARKQKGVENPRLDGGLRIAYDDYLRFMRTVYRKETAKVDLQESADFTNVDSAPNIFKSHNIPYKYGFGVWLECEDNSCNHKAISSPGLFGVYPILHRTRGYIVLLWTYDSRDGIEKAFNLMQALRPSLHRHFPKKL